jgi:hypothetical protein
MDEVLFNDPMEEQIEAEIVAHLFPCAAPEAYCQVVTQQEGLRVRKAVLQREVAESRAQAQRLRTYMDLLKTDLSMYT